MEVGVVEHIVVRGEVALHFLVQERFKGHAVQSLNALCLQAEEVESVLGVLATVDCLDCVQAVLATKSYHFVNLRLVHVLSKKDEGHLDGLTSG